MIENDIKLLEHCVLDLQHRVQVLEKKIKQTQRRVTMLECKADRKTEPQTMYYPQVDGITPSVIVKTEPQTDKGVSYSDHTDYKEPKTYVTWTEPQRERVETMSCQECKHYEVGKPCKPFLNECDCRYEPQTERESE